VHEAVIASLPFYDVSVTVTALRPTVTPNEEREVRYCLKFINF